MATNVPTNVPTNPFDILLDIERTSKTKAMSLPKKTALEKVWLGIGFRSSDKLFVTNVSEIAEVLKDAQITPVASSAIWFRGVTHLRGHLLPITDLEGFIMGKRQKETANSRILVIPYQNTFLGFMVQQVLGMQRFLLENLKPALTEVPKEYLPYVQGMYEQSEKQWNVLSFKDIFENTRFYQIVSESR